MKRSIQVQSWENKNGLSGRLNMPGAHPGQRTQSAEHLVELLRLAGDKLQPVAAGQIRFRTDPLHLLPEPALHALKIKGDAVARIQCLRRAQGEPVIVHKDFVVLFPALQRRRCTTRRKSQKVWWRYF